MRRAAWLMLGLMLGGLVAGGSLVAGGAVLDLGDGHATGAAATREPVTTATARVERRDMRSEAELDGTLGYGEASSLVSGLAGLVTNLPREGAVLRQGDRVMEVDGGRRSGLLYGRKPAWRRIADGMSDGTDVLQLERALRDLGLLSRSVRPDREFDRSTEAAIRRWQRRLGVRQDGVLELGEVLFLPGPVRIGELRVALGERVGPGTTVASVTGTDRVVTLDLDIDDQELVAPGGSVTIELPGGTTVAGTIEDVGTVATAEQDGTVTIPIAISLDDPGAAGSLEGAPVTVRVARLAREDVLAVPVDALLALREGGYAVQVAAEAGSTRYVGVRLGLFTDGWVEVTGDLSEGDTVVVPA